MKPIFFQADAATLPLADKSVDLVFTSPPYCDARTYGIGAQRHCRDWVEWMLDIVSEACRVCRGLVLVNCAGVTRNRIYQPSPEGLLWEWYKRGGHCWRPCYWHRVGIPGSGGKHWLRADVEYILCFKRDNEWPVWSDNTAMGHPPKWAPGGDMSHRLSGGARVNQWGHSFNTGSTGGDSENITCRSGPRPSHVLQRPPGAVVRKSISRQHAKSRADGSDEVQNYVPPSLANPGNLVNIIVGGGVMGSPLAHLNEAPFPEKLAEFFVKSFAAPGATVIDPFSGSGTTACVAARLGRNGIGCDLRASQIKIGTRRAAEPTREKKVKRVKPVPTIEAFELLPFGTPAGIYTEAAGEAGRAG